MLCGAQRIDMAATAVAQWEKQMPCGTKIPRELQSHWILRITIRCAAHINLVEIRATVIKECKKYLGLTILNLSMTGT